MGKHTANRDLNPTPTTTASTVFGQASTSFWLTRVKELDSNKKQQQQQKQSYKLIAQNVSFRVCVSVSRRRRSELQLKSSWLELKELTPRCTVKWAVSKSFSLSLSDHLWQVFFTLPQPTCVWLEENFLCAFDLWSSNKAIKINLTVIKQLVAPIKTVSLSLVLSFCLSFSFCLSLACHMNHTLWCKLN